MWTNLKYYFLYQLDMLAAMFGYYPKNSYVNSLNETLALEVSSMKDEINGLLFGYGELERRHQDNTLIITGLLMSNANDELTLKTAFLQDIYNKGFTVSARNDNDGNVVLSVVLQGEQTSESEDIHGEQ